MWKLGDQCAGRSDPVGSFNAPTTSDYEFSEQAIHHEIEWFFATTFKDVGTSPFRVLWFAGDTQAKRRIASSRLPTKRVSVIRHLNVIRHQAADVQIER